MATLTVYGSTSDGYIILSDATYNTAWTGASGTVVDTEGTFTLGQTYTPETYILYRAFLFFDTSSIPSGADITLATLTFYGNSDGSATDFLITIQNGQPTYPHDPLAAGDYSKANYSGDGGSLTTAGFKTGVGVGKNNVLTLNADGRSWITKAGQTKLCLRSSRDIAGTTPTGAEYVEIVSAESSGAPYRPVLYVEYTVVPYELSCTDGLKAGDSAVMGLFFVLAAVDGLKISDSALYDHIMNFTLSDGAKLSESLSTWLQSYPTATDGVKLSEVLTTLKETFPTLTDGVGLGDMTSTYGLYALLLTDGIKLSDIATHYLTLSLSATDGVKVSDLTSIYGALVIYALLELYSRALIARLHKRDTTVIQEE